MIKKSLLALSASILMSFSMQSYAETLGYNISAQLVCKTSKSGTETVAVSGKGSYVGITDHTLGTQGLASFFNSLSNSPYGILTDATFKSTEIPCTTAKAVIDNQALINFCASTIGVNANLILLDGQAAVTLGASAKLTTKPTASVSLANGLVVYNWDSVCFFPVAQALTTP